MSTRAGWNGFAGRIWPAGRSLETPVLDQHPFHCLPISVSMHDCWIVSICILSGDGGWQVRDAGVEEKGWQDRYLWDAVDNVKVQKQFDNYCMCLTLHQSRNIKKAFCFTNMWFIQGGVEEFYLGSFLYSWILTLATVRSFSIYFHVVFCAELAMCNTRN